MGEVVLSSHARKRMRERKITFEQIKDCIDFPDYVVEKTNKKELFKKFGEKTLKMICSREGKFIKIITLVWK